MSRAARKTSETGIYHIMARGINRQDIFQDEEDKGVYLERLTRYKEECGFEIYAYCLMDNHIHLLIKEGKVKISDVMKKLGTSYAYFYNWKYERTGHLFQDRYRSENVEDDEYLLQVVRYIHQNPLKEGLSLEEWTSYKDYVNKRGITDRDLIFGMLNKNPEKAEKMFVEYMNEANDDLCLDITGKKRLTDEEAKNIIITVGKLKSCQDMQNIDKEKREKVLRKLKEKGLSIRQIERLTGINRGTVLRI